MSQSLKLKDNNYWDSKGIVHNKQLLSGILNSFCFKNFGSYNGLDFNNLRNQIGIYHGRGTPSEASCQNYPINETGDLILFSCDNNFAYQFFCIYNGKLYFRGYYTGTGWSEWKKIC